MFEEHIGTGRGGMHMQGREGERRREVEVRGWGQPSLGLRLRELSSGMSTGVGAGTIEGEDACACKVEGAE